MPNHVHGIFILDDFTTWKKRQPADEIIGQFIQSSTIVIRMTDNNFGWQPGFDDHIIKDENELNSIREYIIANPENWDSDDNFV